VVTAVVPRARAMAAMWESFMVDVLWLG
jgi:hypothetical protein